MIAIKIKMLVASWRDEYSRQYWDTLPVPPPSTLYGFILSYMGETNPLAYRGISITAGLVRPAAKSLVLRKTTKDGDKPNQTGLSIEYQEILSDVELVVWLSHAELEERFLQAFKHPETVNRFGALSLGESSFIVNEVKVVDNHASVEASTFLVKPRGKLHLSTRLDKTSYLNNSTTQYASGDLGHLVGPPSVAEMPVVV